MPLEAARRIVIVVKGNNLRCILELPTAMSSQPV